MQIYKENRRNNTNNHMNNGKVDKMNDVLKKINLQKYIESKMKNKNFAMRRLVYSTKINSKHIHLGRNDEKYVNALLTLDNSICLLLKHITNLIDYGWKYTQYC